MTIRVVATEWSPKLQKYVPIPLDDADWITIQLASRFHGRNVTQQEYEQILADVCAEDDGRS